MRAISSVETGGDKILFELERIIMDKEDQLPGETHG